MALLEGNLRSTTCNCFVSLAVKLDECCGMFDVYESSICRCINKCSFWLHQGGGRLASFQSVYGLWFNTNLTVPSTCSSPMRSNPKICSSCVPLSCTSFACNWMRLYFRGFSKEVVKELKVLYIAKKLKYFKYFIFLFFYLF